MGDKDVLSWPEAVGSGNCLPEVAQIKTNEGGVYLDGVGLVYKSTGVSLLDTRCTS